MASNRSPSPVQTRPTTNPNLRASETNSSIRRSFTGNPFSRPSVHTSPRSFVPNTPANSPAEFGRKLSIGKEGTLRGFEEKENEKVHNLKAIKGKEGTLRGFEEKENEKVHNLKAIKCKSPLKASKNFMSPTISAASKFTPSPRKKILGERNEPIRTSISFSDSQESSVSDIDSKSESGFNQNTLEGLSDLAGFHKKELLKAPKRVTFSDEVLPIGHHESSPYNSSPVIAPYEVSETPNKAEKESDYDSVNLDSNLDLGLFSSPAIAPLDADESDLAGFHKKELLKAPKRVTFSDEVLPIGHHESSPYNSSPVIAPYEVSETPNKAEKESDYDSVNLDSNLDLGLFSSPAIAPLDADPSFPPYDPKTNYLSPRPQFLRYKPNRRMEFEDTDTEETESGDSQKESEDGSTIETLPSEEEEALLLSEPTPDDTPISDQMLKRIFEAKADSFTLSKSEEEELLVFEPVLTGTPISTGMLKQMVEAQSTKPGFFTRTKCIFLILMLLIACVFVSFMDVSITGPPVIEKSSFYKLYKSSEVPALARKKIDRLAGLAGNFRHWCESTEIAEFARENFDGENFQKWYESSDLAIYANKYSHSFAKEFKQYSSNAIFYLSKLLPRLGKEDRSISVQFCNLTDSQEHASSKVGYFEANRQRKVAKIHDEYELEPMVKEVAGRDNLEEMAHSASVVNEQDEEEPEVQRMIQAEMNHSETAEESKDQSVIDSASVFNEQDEEESEVQRMIPAEMNHSETAEESKDQSVIDSASVFSKQDEEESEVQRMIPAEMNHSETAEESKDQSVIDSASVFSKQDEEESEVQRMIPAEMNHSETAEKSTKDDSPSAPKLITPKEFVHETEFSVTDRNSESKSEVVSEVVENKPFKDQSFVDSPASKAKSEVDAPKVITPTEFVRETEFSVTDRNSESKSRMVSEVVENKPFVYAILGISFLVLAVMVASTFIYLKQGKNTTAVNVVTNPEMSAESCPSAMSTYQNSSSYSKGSSKKINKAQSQERKSRPNTKRESLTSSSEFSTGSPSYGSFTTYERIPIKHAYGEEEIATPVRRSSRIRSQITSP